MLRAEREKRGLDIEDAASKLKISARLLRALEDGDEQSLPPLAYTKGFIRSYAAYVGLSAEEVGEALAALEAATETVTPQNVYEPELMLTPRRNLKPIMSTPRRAVVMVEDLNPVQTEKEEVVSGPPVRVAYDAEGKPTKALEGFARTNACALEDVFRLETEKGEYVAVRKHTGGAPALELLAEICPAVITSLSFQKRMHWGNYSQAYARPLRWILALLDEAVIPFSVGPVTSGRETCGHRIHGPGPFAVARADEFLGVLAGPCAITLNPAARRAMIIEGGNAQAEAAGGKVLWKDSLLDEVQGLAEHPVPLLGDFDAAYLEVPREVLLTSMESHQKSFGIEGADGALLPHFLTVLNITPEDMSGCLNRRGLKPFYSSRDKEEAFRNMKLLDIDLHAGESYRGLSGGQQQRVLLARALCATSKLLLLDEPVTGLDPIVTREMYSVIDDLNKKSGITVIMISHDIEAAAEYATHILHLHNYQLFFGCKEDYIKSNAGRQFLGRDITDEIPRGDFYG